jgi:hypothetical protein
MVVSVSQQQQSADSSVDGITVDSATAHSGDIEPGTVPDKIEATTLVLASADSPTNPLVVLKAARWWYLHGKGGSDSAFRWAIEWTRHLATNTPGDVRRFDEFLEYLVTVGFADERAEVR